MAAPAGVWRVRVRPVETSRARIARWHRNELPGAHDTGSVLTDLVSVALWLAGALLAPRAHEVTARRQDPPATMRWQSTSGRAARTTARRVAADAAAGVLDR